MVLNLQSSCCGHTCAMFTCILSRLLLMSTWWHQHGVFFFFLENYWLAMNLRQNPALSCEHKLKHAVLFLLKYTFSSFFFSIQIVISRRSDMLVMSSEGPLGAYVNPLGYVHEIMTLQKANGLALIGRATAEYSWFPGYGLSFYPWPFSFLK